jgi:hypothetical protein
VHVLRPHALDHVAAVAGQPRGERPQPAHRVELCLAGEPHRAVHRERQVGGVDERRRQAERGSDGGLLAQFAPRSAVDERVPLAPLAVDAEPGRLDPDPLQRGQLAEPVRPGGVGAEPAHQVGVDQPVLGGHLGRGVAGDPLQQLPGLDEGDREPGLFEQVSGGDPGDTAAEHSDVDVGELGPRPGRRRGCTDEPVGLGLRKLGRHGPALTRQRHDRHEQGSPSGSTSPSSRRRRPKSHIMDWMPDGGRRCGRRRCGVEDGR